MKNLRSNLFWAVRRMSFLKKVIPKSIKSKLALRFYRNRHERIPFEPALYPAGINLFGYFSASLGLGQGVRLYADALELSNIPYTLIDVRLSPDTPTASSELQKRLADAPIYSMNVIHINPDMLALVHRLLPKSYWDRRYNIGVWLWELERIPPSWREYFKFFDEIWAPSAFIRDAIARDTALPVHVVPYGITAPTAPGVTREYFHLPKDAFLVLCMFDLNSFASRKNPLASVRAYFEAFDGEDAYTHMVIKVHHASDDDIKMLNRLTKNNKNVTIINQELDKPAVNSLIQCCDVLISLHRSEGFGLIMAEAMYLGVPVVATNWSANVDFMSPETACMVDYSLIPTDGMYLYGQKDQRWADADIAQAAQYLRRLYREPEYRKHIAQAGKDSIRQYLSPEHCARIMDERFDTIIKAFPATSNKPAE